MTDAALKVLPQLIAGEPTRLEHEPDQPVVTLAPAAPVPPILVGEFTLHGIVAVEIEGALISGWREYQYRSELPFEEFAAGSLRR